MKKINQSKAKGKASAGFKQDSISKPSKSKGGRGLGHQYKSPLGDTGGVFFKLK
jgi:hypothetical protein